MPLTAPFERHTDRYDRWFEVHDHAYRSELRALEHLVPQAPAGVELGVGTGRFAAPLDIRTGLDPSRQMLQRAVDRGIAGVQGVAERLPFAAATFDTALIVTTICFVDDIDRTLREARRILQPDGQLVIGYIDKDSPVGRQYQAHKDENPFYRAATFVSTDDLVARLAQHGFADLAFRQTIFRPPDQLSSPDRVAAGHGEGSFVAIKAQPA